MVAAYDLVTELDPQSASAEDVSERLQKRVVEFFKPEEGEPQSGLTVKVMDLAVRRKLLGSQAVSNCPVSAVYIRVLHVNARTVIHRKSRAVKQRRLSSM